MRVCLMLVMGLMTFTAVAKPMSLSALLSQFKSLKAGFTETMKTQAGVMRATGHVWIAKPDRFRWQVVKPNQQLFVADGKQVWHYEKDLEQVTVRPLSMSVSGNPMLLLSGQVTDLQKLYHVKPLGDGRFRLTPKNNQGLMRSIVIGFQQQHLSQLQLTNQMGQVTKIQFHNVQLNQVLPVETFIFIPPKGVDVVKLG